MEIEQVDVHRQQTVVQPQLTWFHWHCSKWYHPVCQAIDADIKEIKRSRLVCLSCMSKKKVETYQKEINSSDMIFLKIVVVVSLPIQGSVYCNTPWTFHIKILIITVTPIDQSERALQTAVPVQTDILHKTKMINELLCV